MPTWKKAINFVAVVLSNYKKRPVIGKVLEFTGDSQFVFKHEEPQ